tara:strand:+ start:5255 stop:5491 length:237 start_codon:yes stop_codon:yes gene_type:complete
LDLNTLQQEIIMIGVILEMSWTVIKINNNGDIEFLNTFAPHDRKIAMEEVKKEHGSAKNPVNGYYVIAIVPGNHPVYS